MQECLYHREEYKYLDSCPVCRLERFKLKKDGGNEECSHRRKGGPRKVFLYFPIIPHLKRWFANQKESQLLRWHKEEHKEDGMIRYPSDSIQ